ncbi:ABC transporter substrate-binding protein [Streptomyces cinerochromogenes]|uniref:ABC transporter substrate-binding protein n=1 Tax=Streptomyces cinerochromogenes TaxID=66422 RepID=UPI0033B2AB55
MSAHPGDPATAAPGTRRRPSRRLVRTVTVVASCLALLAAAVVVGARVLGQEPTVTLLANWTGDDETNFRKAVIEPFERKYHIHVDYQGSNAESQVLGADVEAGTPPDVVVLTGPGELAEYARQKHLLPLEGLVDPEDFGPSWAMRLTDGHVYWFPLKADLKSIVWYPGEVGAQQRGQAAHEPAQWCVGMGSGATSGWPGTDWIEDILLQRYGPKVYEQWARGDLSWRSKQVRDAWTTWRDLVGAGGDPDLVRRALKTPFGAVSRLVTTEPRGCTLEHQASFIRGRQAWRQADGRWSPSAPLLVGTAANRAWEVSGDLVALLHSTPEARKLIRYLASTDAQRAWGAEKSGFSVHTDVRPGPGDPDSDWRLPLARTLRDPEEAHCFDASDAMPPAVRDAFAEATIEFLAHRDHLETLLRSLETLSNTRGPTWLRSVCDRTPD